MKEEEGREGEGEGGSARDEAIYTRKRKREAEEVSIQGVDCGLKETDSCHDKLCSKLCLLEDSGRLVPPIRDSDAEITPDFGGSTDSAY